MKLMNLLERLVVTQERIADAFEEQTRTNTERSAWLTNIEDNELDRRRDEVIAAQQGATDALVLNERYVQAVEAIASALQQQPTDVPFIAHVERRTVFDERHQFRSSVSEDRTLKSDICIICHARRDDEVHTT